MQGLAQIYLIEKILKEFSEKVFTKYFFYYIIMATREKRSDK